MEPVGSNVIGDVQTKPNSVDLLREVHLAVLGDSEGVEYPVHTEEHPTEAVFLDHLSQPVRERAYPTLPYSSRVGASRDRHLGQYR